MSIFVQDVCNAFIAAAIWHVLQALNCSCTVIQRLHSTFGLFAWSAAGSLTSRDNLFHYVKFGGLGSAHLLVQQVVSRLFVLGMQNTGLSSNFSNKISNIFTVSRCFFGVR